MTKQGSNEVTVEVVAVGDDRNYPQRGNTVTIHYTGYLLGSDSNVQFDTVSALLADFQWRLQMKTKEIYSERMIKMKVNW